MQEYEKFWHGSLPQGNNQLLIDYDTFIDHFSKEIEKHTSIKLNQVQKRYIKMKIDPENQNQVYKNGYLLFIKDYWSIPSNRTKLFNMKMNLKEVNLSKQQLEGSREMVGSLRIRIVYFNEQGQSHTDQYVLEANKIKGPKDETELKNQGFFTFGSGINNEINVDNIYLNQQHFKVIYTSNMEQPLGSSPSFMKQPKLVTKFYFRDISKSNRVQYVLDNCNKYLVLKKGMIINLGLIDGLYQIIIEDVNEVVESKLLHLQTTMNADNISFVPGIPNKPEKTIINFDMERTTEAMVTDMYDRNLFYPVRAKINSPKKKKDENNCFLKFSLINTQNLQKTLYTDKNKKKLRVGRHKEGDIVIEDIRIRDQQFYFEAVNDMWFLRKSEGVENSVYLSCESERNSNRMSLNEKYAQILKVRRGLQIEMKVEKPVEEDDF